MAAPESLQRAFELHRAGRLDDAERLYRQVLAREPRNAEAWHLLGVAAQQRGKHAEAIGHLARAIELDPNNATFHFNLATAHAEQGRPQQAIASMREVIRLEPHHFPAHNSLGALLAASSRGDEAAACFRQALAIRPDYAPALVNLGRTLNRQGRAQEAATCFQQAIRLNPDDAQAHVGLGAALHASRQPEKALAAYQRALQIKPDFAEVHNNIGQLMLERGDLAAALARLDRAAEIQPDLPLVHNNRGIVLAMLGRYDEALTHFNRALSIDPDYTDAHFSRATLLLSLGDYASGWSEYEWRLRAPDAPQRPPGPAWNGEPLAGRAILLYAEQGQGDILQFIRYAPRVKARGGRVIVGCAARLIPILSTCQGVDRFFNQHDPVPPFEVHAALASLPGILGTDAHSIPADVPYLSADAELVEQWRAKLPSDSRLRVGINWQGSPTHRDDRRRSMPLAELAPLARVEGVRLFSLQKGFGVEQLAGAPFEVVDLGSRLDEGEAAFCDTAAVIKNLDLVITSDTAVAHLAGALGAPVWVALTRTPDWRWLLDRDDSPWYPTMRLFRQQALGQWNDVFESMAESLRELAAHTATSRPTAVEPRRDAHLDEAERRYRQTVAAEPRNAVAWHLLGIAAHQRGNHAEAIAHLARAIELDPNNAAFHYNLATAHAAQGRPEQAIASMRDAIRLEPNDAQAHNDLGALLVKCDRCEEAVACLRQALALRPDFAMAHHNLAIASAMMGRFDLARAQIDRALSMDPNSIDAHLTRATLLLMLGDYAAGWKEYEWRLRAPDAAQLPPGPAWNGEPLAGRTIMLYAEQGLGDVLQFIRYAPQVKARGGTVLACCEKKLTAFLSTCQGIDRFYNFGDPMPPHDVQAALLSLPRILQTDAHSIPARVPYLSARPDLVEQWRAKLPSDGRLRVGINWQGNPSFRYDRARSIPLAEFAPLARVDGVRLFSLQKGFGIEQLADAPFEVQDLGSQVDNGQTNLCEAAAVIKNLDLVITSDTAVAHLAGALGAPVWVALTRTPDWRWLLDRDDSPWYPTMRLFRQQALGQWEEVFQRMVAPLERLVAAQARR